MNPASLAVAYLAVAKWVTYLGLFGLTGATATRAVMMPLQTAAQALPPGVWPRLERRLYRVGVLSAAMVIVAAILRLYAQTYSVFGLDEPVTVELVRVIALESRWGTFWRPQIAVAVGVAATIGWAAVRPRPAWRATAVMVVLLWATLPLTGHAVTLGTHLPWFLQIGHGLAAAAWLGTLAVVLAVVAVATAEPGADAWVSAVIDRFSRLALWAVSIVLVTGGATAWLYVDALSQLRTTPWGLTLLAKIALVGATGAVGAYNWRRVRPRLGNAAGTRALVRSARVELALGVVLLMVTATLVHLAMPYELE